MTRTRRTSTIEHHPDSVWDGVRISEDGDSYTHYAIFPASTPDDEIMDQLGYPSAFYTAPGFSFSHGPHIRRNFSRTLVTYRVAQDI